MNVGPLLARRSCSSLLPPGTVDAPISRNYRRAVGSGTESNLTAAVSTAIPARLFRHTRDVSVQKQSARRRGDRSSRVEGIGHKSRSALPSRSAQPNVELVSAERLLNLGVRIIVGEFGPACQLCLQNGSTETKPNRHNGPEWRLFHASMERALGDCTRIRTYAWQNQNPVGDA
jgi:hypothetical protein